MLREYLSLITHFVSDEMTASEFEREYLKLWRQDRDVHRLTPEDQAIENTWYMQFKTGEMSEAEYRTRFRSLHEKYYVNSDLQPFSDEQEIINELFYDVDAYVGDPNLFEEGDFGADELREAARKALDQLTALQAERDKSA